MVLGLSVGLVVVVAVFVVEGLVVVGVELLFDELSVVLSLLAAVITRLASLASAKVGAKLLLVKRQSTR